jgi:hypothetical protein
LVKDRERLESFAARAFEPLVILWWPSVVQASLARIWSMNSELMRGLTEE